MLPKIITIIKIVIVLTIVTPQVKTALILCFVLLSLVSHSLLRFYEPVKDYFGPQSSEVGQLWYHNYLMLDMFILYVISFSMFRATTHFFELSILIYNEKYNLPLRSCH